MLVYTNIVCLLNILTPWRSKADGFFDFIREPISQGCEINIRNAPGRLPSNLLPNFSLNHFRNIVQDFYNLEKSELWLTTYYQMPEKALDYLFSCIPENSLILTSEAPPWLRNACETRNKNFLDIRQSPLGFGRDSYIALDTNDPTLRDRLTSYAIPEEEIRLEAGLLQANMRIHRAQLEEGLRHVFNLDETLIYIWQTPWDPNLLRPNGKKFTISDFEDEIKKLSTYKKVLFLRDFGNDFTATANEKEKKLLSEITEKPVSFCPQNIYQILTGHDKCELFSINSNTHHEAKYFQKKSFSLTKPAITLSTSTDSKEGYIQVHFQDFLKPEFWNKIITPHIKKNKFFQLSHIDRHLARENMNDWGEQEKVLTWERYLPLQAYRRLGGTVAHRRIEELEKNIILRNKKEVNKNINSDIKKLRNTKTGQTAYVLGNGPSLNELDIQKIMELDSFWCNKAYKMQKDGFTFKPKYYLLYDPIIIHQDPEAVLNINAELKFFAKESFDLAKILAPEKTDNIIAFNPIYTPPMHTSEDNFSTDPTIGLFHGGSILTFAIQIAFYMGYSRVLVGGADLDYSKPYFYGSTHKHKNTNITANAEKMQKSFHVLRKNFEKNGRILAKITESPALPLEYIEIKELKSK